MITHEADSSTKSVSHNLGGLPDTTTDEDDVTYIYDYDAVYGRLIQKTDIDGNYIAYGYDAQGNLIERSKHDSTGTRTARKRWDYQHPTLPGKLWKEIKPDNSFSEYGYDSEGNVNSVTDFNGNTTSYAHDSLNRFVTVTQPGTVVTSHDYDLHNNLVSVLDAENQETTYTYDDMGRVVSTTSPDTGTVTYVYDAPGNLVQRSDAKGITVTYTYDLLNRLTLVDFPVDQDITYTYDQGTFGMGRRTAMTDPSGSTDFAYDNRGRLTSKVSTINSIDYSISRVNWGTSLSN